MKKVLYIVSIFFPPYCTHASYPSLSLLTTLPPTYTLPITSRLHPFLTLHFNTFPFTSLHFFTLLDDFHFTSLPFNTLLNDFATLLHYITFCDTVLYFPKNFQASLSNRQNGYRFNAAFPQLRNKRKLMSLNLPP